MTETLSPASARERLVKRPGRVARTVAFIDRNMLPGAARKHVPWAPNSLTAAAATGRGMRHRDDMALNRLLPPAKAAA